MTAAGDPPGEPSGSFSRRGIVAGALALAACGPRANSQPAAGPAPALKDFAFFPFGACVQASHLEDPAIAGLLTRHVSQITAEWEMKMEYMLLDTGGFRFDRPDRMAAFAQAHAMRLFGHALIWYAQKPIVFQDMAADRAAFAAAYDRYITAVVGRYRGRVCGWDVINEAVKDDGSALRDHMWSQALGELDHMTRAFKVARAADPVAPLFINDYNLESVPAKLDLYQRLIERLLKAGAPLSGIGCQTHCNADLPAGALTRTIAALGRFGLPVHVSEMDVSITRARGLLTPRAEREAAQARLYAEAIQAFCDLPARQRFAFTVWGMRDSESWLVRENRNDAPLLFDGQGRAKSSHGAVIKALAARRRAQG